MKKLLVLFSLLFISISAFSQSADVITDILDSQQATLGQICYLAAVQKGYVSEKATYQQALQEMEERRKIPSYQYADMPVPYANLAYIYAQVWDVKGGIMYRLFKAAPRYAFKQLKYDGVLPANADPNHLVSGKEALDVLTMCSVKYGNMELPIDE